MKQDKVINIILVAVNVILTAVCAVLYLGTDRTDPRFVIQPAEVIYTPGMEESALYGGIGAHDDRDGEITDKIVIEKIVENQAEKTAIVYYAVSDAAGNVAKFSKLFPAEYPVEVSAAVGGEGDESQVIKELEKDRTSADGAVGDGKDGTGNGGQDGEEDNDDQADSENGRTGGEDDRVDNDSEDGRTDSREDASDNRAEGADDRTGEDAGTSEPTRVSSGSGAPELALRSSEVTISSGANVPWTEIISTLRDDKDDYAALYYNLQVSQYDRNRPGTYPVTVYTEDSDGNRSQTAAVTIIVR